MWTCHLVSRRNISHLMQALLRTESAPQKRKQLLQHNCIYYKTWARHEAVYGLKSWSPQVGTGGEGVRSTYSLPAKEASRKSGQRLLRRTWFCSALKARVMVFPFLFLLFPKAYILEWATLELEMNTDQPSAVYFLSLFDASAQSRGKHPNHIHSAQDNKK